MPNVAKKLSIGSSYAVNILCGLWVNLGWTWMALKAHLICCDPLVVALSNNLKSKKYYLSKFPSNKSGKWGKMTHVISDLLFSNKNYAQKATSTVQACFIKKTDKRARISKIQSKFFLAHWYAFKLPAKTTLRNFPDGGSK